GGSRIVLAEPLFAQSLGLELYVCFDLRAEIARLSPPPEKRLKHFSEHGLNLLGRKNARDGCRQPVPFRGLFRQLLAARSGQRIKAGLAVVCRGAPLRGNPASILESLERRIECSVFH